LAIVFACAVSVGDYAAAGKQVEVPGQVCPSCGRRLNWWSGYWRMVRRGGKRFEIWVRRGRCPPCAVTHVLLPDFVVKRRRYAVEEIGAALELAAQRVSAWRSSVQLELPFGTVRDWFRRCRERAQEQLAKLARLAVRMGAQIGELPTQPLAALVVLLKAVWTASRERDLGLSGVWRFWNQVCSGTGLASNREPGWA
jgi:hypothetical protein